MTRQRPSGLALLDSNRPVFHFRRSGHGLAFDTYGPPDGVFRFQGLRPHSWYRGVVTSAGERLEETTFSTGSTGEGTLAVSLAGRGKVVVDEVSVQVHYLILFKRFFRRTGRYVLLALVCAAAGLFFIARRPGIGSAGGEA